MGEEHLAWVAHLDGGGGCPQCRRVLRGRSAGADAPFMARRRCAAGRFLYLAAIDAVNARHGPGAVAPPMDGEG